MEKTIRDTWIYAALLLILGFLAANVNPTLAIVFISLLVFSWLYYAVDRQHTIVIERTRNLTKSFVYAILGYGAVVLISSFIKGAGLFGITDTRSIFEIMAESQALSLQTNLYLAFFVFGILIPIIETTMIGTVLEFMMDLSKFLGNSINFEKLNFWLVAIFFIISTGFMYMHLSAKGVTNESALMTVIIFGLVTCFLIFIERQMLAAILMHIISNSVSLSVSYGWFTTISTALIFGIGFVLVIVYLLKNIKITPRGFI